MPARLKSQWTLLRQALAYQKPRCVPRSYGGSRCYGAYTWLTKSPENLGVDDFFASFPTEPFERASSLTSVPLLLVTPGLAHYLDPQFPFLDLFVNKLYTLNSQQRDGIYTVVAVVDKIPNFARKLATTSPSVSENGEYEGLSVLLVEEADLQWKAAPPRRIGNPSGEEPSLAVAVKCSPTDQNSQGAAHEVGLRLANTVFINGKERTLTGMFWAATQGEQGARYTLQKTADLTSCCVSTNGIDIASKLTLPLYPVGERRTVIAGMGNILRQLSKSTDSTSMVPMPASTELEKELPRYIEEHNIADRRVSVWALVEKPHAEPVQEASTSDRLSHALRQGGKLHRVMSGGGGWGKKQGLLSLDPEIAFPKTAWNKGSNLLVDAFNAPTDGGDMEMPPMFLENGLIGEDLSHLSQVANPGDSIQFFVAVEPKAIREQETASESGSNISYTFGVVSDAEDMNIQAGHGSQGSVISVPNSFGALSEKAITYSQPVPQAGMVVESSTKLDIPGCRVTLQPR
ncbi:hypothetical protein N7468_004317 [Penicillium chermesinum]|uniref:Uncharacterized protein n=1 Tax=Penicillium chermesinum TaxID=63820 RepID=A0A9W9PAP3_9EURO|nr:uncharacterized protein N7468_004317 [Penicillium chermesinum]KAJ5239698.1 hypothetical protein N7468_004317 [Penicillium chermesinum]KAJ6166582.1 hypothetical protein N7470_002029 [Penicillium chermesinum]